VGAGTPVKSVREYIAWARQNPTRSAYGIPLAGGPGHFLGVMLAKASGVDLAPVPYKGSPPLVTDLVGGQVPAGIALVSDFVAQHRAGKLRMIACFGPQRSPAAPGVPTLKEEGFPDAEGLGWIAFHTVAGTPREMIDRQSRAIASALKAPEVSEQLLSLGLEPVGSTPDELASRSAEDTARWTRLVKASGFTAAQ
jgi:tripartite-type tricarboxylate transporter receptor subunit TctC